MKLSIIGLGKLGAPMAAVMAHKGHTVVGVDINPHFVEAIHEGRAPVNEPQLAEMIDGQSRAAHGHGELRGSHPGDRPDLHHRADAFGPRRPVFDEVRAEGGGEDRRGAAQEEGVAPGGAFEHGDARIGGRRRCCRRSKGIPARRCAGGFRPVLQPGVHRAGQRGARHAESGHDPDRRIGCAVGRDSGGVVHGRLREQSAHPAHELRERGADQAFGEHVRHHQDLLRQHAGADLRDAARGGRRTW